MAPKVHMDVRLLLAELGAPLTPAVLGRHRVRIVIQRFVVEDVLVQPVTRTLK